MKLSTFADRAIRVMAVATAMPFCFVTLLVGIMANDAGNAAGERGSVLVLGLGGALVLWVMLASTAPELITNRFSRWPVLGQILSKVPTYLFAAGGLLWAAHEFYLTVR